MNERSSAENRSNSLDELLDAAERVLATTPPSKVTMRLIAEEAGLSLGLAYHYVDDKESLFGAVLERIGERLSAPARSSTDPGVALVALWDALEASPAFPRLMTSLVLEGRNLSEIMPRHPVIADLAAEAAERGAPDPNLVAAMQAFLGISLQIYEILMNRTMACEDDDTSLREAIADMFSAWFKSQFDVDGPGLST